MLFEGWGLQHIEGAWKSHPFHPDNHVNALIPDADGDGRGLEVHTPQVPAVTRFQEAYVRRVVEAVNDLDNAPLRHCQRERRLLHGVAGTLHPIHPRDRAGPVEAASGGHDLPVLA